MLTAVLLFSWQGLPLGAGVAGTRHDLSTNFEPYSNQPCAFCHTPHGSNLASGGPLWNRFVDTAATYVIYASDTIDSLLGQPGIESRLCLGCHDGTLATAVVNGISGTTMHDLINAPGPGGTPDTTSYPNCERCHTEIYYGRPPKWQGKDLSNDHPIGMTYPPPVSLDPDFQVPPLAQTGWPGGIRLFGSRVECPSCHNPHDDSLPPFLVTPNVGSALCLTCHLK